MNAFKILRWVLNWESPIFLPLPNKVEEPPCTYLFVAMEPSGNWLRTGAEGRRKVREFACLFEHLPSAPEVPVLRAETLPRS